MANKRTNDVDQLDRIAQELKAGTWPANARRRSQRRKSAWNLLLPLFGLPIWGATAALLVWLATSLHMALYPGAVQLFGGGEPLRANAALILLPCLVAAVCPAMVITNFVVYLIPPARQAMDAEDRDFPGTDYDASQRALLKAGLWVLAVCAPLVLAGAILA